MTESELRELLTRYKLALQPNKHITTWRNITEIVAENWGLFSKMINNDFLVLRDIVKKEYKKRFPYLSGPKIFNY